MKGKTEINISSIIKNQTNDESYLKNFILNINVKTPKILSKLFLCTIFISSVIMIFVTLAIIQQLQDLQTQMHSLRLMCQNNLNNHGNRFHRMDVSDYNDFVSSLIPSTLEFSNKTEIRDNRNSNIISSTKFYNQIIFNRSRDENNTIKRNASSLLNTVKLLNKLIINLLFDSNNRQNLRSETQNYTMTEDERSDDYELIKWSEPRTKRLRRNAKDSEEHSEEKDETWQQQKKDKKRQQNEKKDKKLRQEDKNNTQKQQNEKKRKKWNYSEEKNKKRQNRRGCKHNCRRWRPSVATFVGEIPEQITNTVHIGPWFKLNVSHEYDFDKFYLVENNMSIEISISGLFMISVQIIYSGNSMTHSYWILVNSEGSSEKQKPITCATVSIDKEVSCYTSTVIYLQRGDRISLQQQEKNRRAVAFQGGQLPPLALLRTLMIDTIFNELQLIDRRVT